MRRATWLLIVSMSAACNRREPEAEEAPAASAPAAVPAPSDNAETAEEFPGPAARAAAEARAAEGRGHASAVRYAVFGVRPGDVLNVREEPDPKSAQVQAFLWNARDVLGTGRSEQRKSELWVEVTAGAKSGWVNRAFLVEQGRGCDDPRIAGLAHKFAAAVRAKDGKALESLASPLRGLQVRHEAWNPTLRFKGDALSGIFSSRGALKWGQADGSGDPIVGSFSDVALPSLQKVLQPQAQRACGKVLAEGSAGSIEWPLELASMTLFSFHKPSSEGMDWITWVAGIEYVEQKPYIAMLIQYHWEI